MFNVQRSIFTLFFLALLLQRREVFLPQHKRLRQVVFPHYRVGCQLFRRPVEQDATLEQQIGAVGDTQRIFHVMVGNQDTDIQ